MPVTATAPTNKYRDLVDFRNRYKTVSKCIFFGKHLYEYKDFKCEGDTDIHLYRCDAEMHNLKIYMRNGKVHLVEGSYSVDPIKL